MATKKTNKKKTATKSTARKTTAKKTSSKASSPKKTTASYQSAASYAKRKQTRAEAWEWLCLCALIFVLLCLFMPTKLGTVGGGIYKGLVGTFGFAAFPIIIWLIICMIIRMFAPKVNFGWKGFLGFLFFCLLSVVGHLICKPGFIKAADCYAPVARSGGWLGFVIGDWMYGLVGFGSYFILFALMALILFVIIGVSLKQIIADAGSQTAAKAHEISEEIRAGKQERLRAAEEAKQQEQEEKKNRTPIRDGVLDISTLDNDYYTEKKRQHEAKTAQTADKPVEKETEKEEKVPAISFFDNTQKKETEPEFSKKPLKGTQTELKFNDAASGAGYTFPSVDLLALPKPRVNSNIKADLMKNAKILEESLASFGVEARVTQVNQGPAVTRYELQPKTGVKVSRIVNLADDIALNLAAPAIRIEAPIPGKSAVGIEVPNKESTTVTLREIIDSSAFKNAKSKLTFALGKSIDGDIMVADIAKMPHLLIAGATGSGKSVCINSIIISLLYKADPNDVQMMLIDPKMVEMVVYNGIPHLITANKKSITDSKLASAALAKMVAEMERRYQLFADFNVRDIVGYNEAVETMEDETHKKMPHIVIIIDELADLMMVAAKEVEESICRLAQKARAAGMHLIVATQRPSVDVVTGLIKANIPSRLAFAVSSGVDSRTILDMVGAEKLLGKGDMLFAPIGASKPTRIQGAFVSDHEVEKVVEAVRTCPVPANQVTLADLTTTSSGASDDEDGDDEFLSRAIEMVVRSQKCSSSQLQREFRVGFNRAARMVEEMEKRGIVSAQDAAGKRKVLMDWATYCNNED